MSKPLFGRVASLALVTSAGTQALDLNDTATCYKVVATNYVAGLLGAVKVLTQNLLQVTAKDSEVDKVVGLEIGADDYVTKPFSSRELVARIRAVLRRQGEPPDVEPTALEAGPVRMDVDRHRVTVDGVKVELPLKEFDLLELLLRNAGRVLTRAQLIDRIWGSDYVGDTKTLDVHVKRLRAKLESDPSHPTMLVTVRGLGYKLDI